ncbi:MAG: GTP cyclohydrolase II [Enterococcus sp.]
MKKIDEAIATLKQGGLVIVADDENRESEGDLIGLADYVSAESINFMTKKGRGLICAPLSQKIADKFDLSEMTTQNTDAFGTAFTVSVDHTSTSTGISAADRARTIKYLSDTRSTKQDFLKPGHIFPLIAQEGGVLTRRGHTEAAIDLAKVAGSSEVAYICEILNEDGTMARYKQLQKLAKEWKLPLLTIDDLALYMASNVPLQVNLPTVYGTFDLTLFEDEVGKEHLLLSKGNIKENEEPLLVRLHSECLTGDIFGSRRCDCGEQLHQSMKKIEEEGRGAILYLRQEGRGIGLKNKLKAYKLQEEGKDTYEANVALGFAPDERDYSFAAKILKSLGSHSIRLLTNNPEKVHALQEQNIHVVERIPIEIAPQKENIDYLKTKKEKFHHYLSI